jgi:hypothetical protein
VHVDSAQVLAGYLQLLHASAARRGTFQALPVGALSGAMFAFTMTHAEAIVMVTVNLRNEPREEADPASDESWSGPFVRICDLRSTVTCVRTPDE